MCYKKKEIDNDNEMNDENGFGAGQSKVVGDLTLFYLTLGLNCFIQQSIVKGNALRKCTLEFP